MSSNHILLNEIRQFHNKLGLAGGPYRGLLNVSDEVLSYVVSILRQKEPTSLPQVSDKEWSNLLVHLSHHRIIPLIYWQITQFPAELRPPEMIVAQMREIFLRNDVHYLVFVRQFREIQNAFKKEKICALVFKGFALACTVYPDFATRPSFDIDLLVKPKQFLRAREVLSQIGYQCRFKRFEMFQELSKAEQFVNKTDARKPFEVDLHWNLFHYYGIWRNNSVEEFFHSSETVETPLLAFDTLGKADALIQAAIHLSLNHPEGIRLQWISDTALLAKKLADPEEWEDLQKRTTEFKAHLALEIALKLAQMWNGLRVPEKYRDFSKWLNPGDEEKAEMSYAMNKQGPDIRMKGYIAVVRSAPRKIPFLMKLIFPDPDFMLSAYPPSRKWLLPWSYVRRWNSWIVKVAQSLFLS